MSSFQKGEVLTADALNALARGIDASAKGGASTVLSGGRQGHVYLDEGVPADAGAPYYYVQDPAAGVYVRRGYAEGGVSLSASAVGADSCVGSVASYQEGLMVYEVYTLDALGSVVDYETVLTLEPISSVRPDLELGTGGKYARLVGRVEERPDVEADGEIGIEFKRFGLGTARLPSFIGSRAPGSAVSLVAAPEGETQVMRSLLNVGGVAFTESAQSVEVESGIELRGKTAAFSDDDFPQLPSSWYDVEGLPVLMPGSATGQVRYEKLWMQAQPQVKKFQQRLKFLVSDSVMDSSANPREQLDLSIFGQWRGAPASELANAQSGAYGWLMSLEIPVRVGCSEDTYRQYIKFGKVGDDEGHWVLRTRQPDGEAEVVL